MFNFHVHLSNCSKYSICSVDITEIEQFSNIQSKFTFGIHPWFLQSEKIFDEYIRILTQISEGNYGPVISENFIAVGECGIDRVKGPCLELQKKIFFNLCRLSINMDLPMIIHCVRAYSDIIEVYKSFKNKLKWAVHGFSGNLVEAESLLAKNIHISFGKRLLYSDKLKEIFSILPINMLFLETDDSDISIRSLYELGSVLKGMSIDEFSLQIERNIFNFFAIL